MLKVLNLAKEMTCKGGAIPAADVLRVVRTCTGMIARATPVL